MTPIGPLVPPPGAAHTTQGENHDTKLAEAATQFEAILLRSMLKPLERAVSMGSGSAQSPYGSMAVEALADAIAKAGGLGLGKLIETHLDGAHQAQAIDNTGISSVPAPTDTTPAQAIDRSAVQPGVHGPPGDSPPATLLRRHR